MAMHNLFGDQTSHGIPALREETGTTGKMGEVMESDSAARRGRRLSVGSRVSTRQAWGSGLAGDPGLRKSGMIIEDHGDVVADSARSYGRDWALPRRWAIALDDGSLVFRDDDELEDD